MSDNNSESPNNTKCRYAYAIVAFQSEQMTELVPLSWVYNKDGQDYCYYPPQKDYKYMDEWLVSLAEPEPHWKSYVVEILSQTKTLEKGKQRLERSYRTKEVESTDGEGSIQKKPVVVVLSEKSLRRNLRDVPAMPFSNPASSPTSTKNAKVVNKEQNNNSFTKANASTHEHAREGNAASGISKEYLDEKLNQLETSINSTIRNIKRSLLYDIEMKSNEIKNAIISNIGQATANINSSEARAGIGVPLPIKNLEDFVTFDEALKEDDEKKKALMSLFRVLVCGETEAKDCISKVMTATITKSVEIYFSGTGRLIKGVGKKNFSATATFGCLKDTLLEKFGDSGAVKSLEGKVGRWLSGAGDRDGGRASRSKGDAEVLKSGNTGDAASGINDNK